MLKVHVVWLVFLKFGLNYLIWEISPGLLMNRVLLIFDVVIYKFAYCCSAMSFKTIDWLTFPGCSATAAPVNPQDGPLDCPQNGTAVCPQDGPVVRLQDGPLVYPQDWPVVRPQDGPVVYPELFFFWAISLLGSEFSKLWAHVNGSTGLQESPILGGWGSITGSVRGSSIPEGWTTNSNVT